MAGSGWREDIKNGDERRGIALVYENRNHAALFCLVQ
jgi:hypothetical protein